MIEGKWTMIPGLHFEKNLAALKKIHPSQGEAIATLSPKVEYRLYPVTPLGDGFFNVTIPLPAEHSVSLFLTPDPQNELRNGSPIRCAAPLRRTRSSCWASAWGTKPAGFWKHCPPMAS